jgi:hypothetical protein
MPSSGRAFLADGNSVIITTGIVLKARANFRSKHSYHFMIIYDTVDMQKNFYNFIRQHDKKDTQQTKKSTINKMVRR